MIAAEPAFSLQASRPEAFAPRLPDAGAIAGCALRFLLQELETWPKPGLVSHIDSGSHTDMDADTFRASAATIAPFFEDLVEAGARGSGMDRLRIIGLEAESVMLAATGGGNAHRGAIFDRPGDGQSGHSARSRAVRLFLASCSR